MLTSSRLEITQKSLRHDLMNRLSAYYICSQQGVICSGVLCVCAHEASQLFNWANALPNIEKRLCKSRTQNLVAVSENYVTRYCYTLPSYFSGLVSV